ncbi:MAG: deoxyribodipyrimidine photo-lyase [Rhodospirillales bacterium]|nr:MAG: deoxyribodipyrimidine photo-lyase [Rhodospirillales bacterium]
MAKCTIVWFRRDLRLADNPAVAAAIARGAPVVPVYILDESTGGDWRTGAAQRWWLHHSLAALDSDLRARGSRLVLRRGPADQAIRALQRETGASSVLWNRRYDAPGRSLDGVIKSGLREDGVAAESFNAALLFEPLTVRTKAGGHFRVYTPFVKACRALPEPAAPLPAPLRIPAPASWPDSDPLDSWRLLPRSPDWAGGLRETWTPGEAGARTRLASFLDGGLARYAARRDRPDVDGTSRLSPHLALGEIGPRQIWMGARDVERSEGGDGPAKFLAELLWREFCHHQLFHEESLPENPVRPEFAAFPWRPSPALLAAWRKGATGVPIVDAGMRQLWRTGWMHNRVRMVVGSFLVKNLLQPWRDGEAWFWDTLVDADLANNAAGWQWVAGCGADAAPFFRVFNPVLQGERFDSAGAYVRRYIPELAALPDDFIHKPWTAGASVLRKAGVTLGATYPEPVVDLAASRARALEAFASLRRGAT